MKEPCRDSGISLNLLRGYQTWLPATTLGDKCLHKKYDVMNSINYTYETNLWKLWEERDSGNILRLKFHKKYTVYNVLKNIKFGITFKK